MPISYDRIDESKIRRVFEQIGQHGASVTNHLIFDCCSTIRKAFAALAIATATLAPFGPAQATEYTNLFAVPGFNLGWTQVVQVGNGYTLFYNANTGAGATGRMSASAPGFVTVKGYPAGSFANGWTSIVPVAGGLFYYNASNGAAAFGMVSPFGDHTTIRGWPAGTFSTGWTKIQSNGNGSNLLLYYNAVTGLGAVGWIR